MNDKIDTDQSLDIITVITNHISNITQSNLFQPSVLHASSHIVKCLFVAGRIGEGDDVNNQFIIIGNYCISIIENATFKDDEYYISVFSNSFTTSNHTVTQKTMIDDLLKTREFNHLALSDKKAQLVNLARTISYPYEKLQKVYDEDFYIDSELGEKLSIVTQKSKWWLQRLRNNVNKNSIQSIEQSNMP